MRFLAICMLAALGGAVWLGCGSSPKPKVALEDRVSIEELRMECEGGELKSCRFAHDRDETACRSRHDGKACWRAAMDFEKGLGVVANRDQAVWAISFACSNGVAEACSYAPNVADGCWIGTPCNGRCLGRTEVCKE